MFQPYMNSKLPPVVNTHEDPSLKTDDVFELASQACKKFGAWNVRRAARQQIDGDHGALKAVGLGHQNFSFEHLLRVSSTAMGYMTDEEKHREFCQDHQIEFWWPL
jgi:hypothetical protein